MSNTNMKVALEIVVNDRGSREAGQAVSVIAQKNHEAARQQQRDAATVGAANARYSDQSRRASVVLAQQQMAASRSASSRVLRDAERLHSARTQLGIRSEKSLQREIIQTAIAYRRLEESGRVSGRELARAAEAAQHKVRMLQREMRQLKTPSEWGKGLAAIGAGIAAGVAVARRPLSETMAYDQRVAAISNTAYASEGVEGRRRGQRQISEVITQSVRKGGTREEAADALDGLLGASGLAREEAFAMLPTVQQMALAAGRKSREIVPLVGALKANQIPVADMPAALGKMLHAGETGGYGVQNMIDSLPRLLAAQRDNYGIAGMKGLEMALVDMRAITAATNMPQESAQSLTALMSALKQRATAQAVAKKLSIGGKAVDLAGTLGKGALQDVSPLETFTAMIDRAMVNNTTYKRLKGRLEKGGSQADQEQMAALLESSVFRDAGIGRQSILALSGYMSQRDTVKGLRSEYAGAGVQALETSSAVMMATAGEQVNQAGQAIADARQRALQPITDAMGDMAKKVTEYAQTYPGLTSAIVGATDGIKVMTAAAVAFGGVKALTGVGAQGIGVGAAVSGIASKAAGVTKAAARGAPIVPLALGAYETVQIANSDLPADQKKVAYTRTASSTAGGMGGAYAGVQAGAIFGPWGMLAGGILGGLMGSQAGDEFGQEMGNAWFAPGRSRTEPPKGVAPPMSSADLTGLQGLRRELVGALRESSPTIEVKVELDGREIAASVNEHNAREARRD
ncbi:hypothetical protein WJ974_00495 [Achromobacter xylosoxidans]